VVFGNESDIVARLEKSPSKTINTAYVERSNLDWRLWDAHSTRKSVAFARSPQWLEAKLFICVVWCNFVRIHSSLGKNNNGKVEKLTPAMAAGIANRPWNVSTW
jgi:hypothetical protein